MIAVTSVNSVDSTLRSIYNGMIAKLKTGDIQAALTAVTGTAHDRYQAVFNALAGALPSIADLTGQLQQGVIGPGVAEYFVLQNSGNGPQLIPVYFLLGEDGVWRIESM